MYFFFLSLAFDDNNTTLLKLQTVLFLFFPNSALPNWVCGLSMDTAYTWTFTVLGTNLPKKNVSSRPGGNSVVLQVLTLIQN